MHQIIGDAVIKSPDIEYATASEQYRILIAPPLDTFCVESEGAGNILIVLDALDECQGVEEKQPKNYSHACATMRIELHPASAYCSGALFYSKMYFPYRQLRKLRTIVWLK